MIRPCIPSASVRHKAAIHRMVKSTEKKMEWKRRRMPGMPDVALQDGHGTLSMADVMVTWVFTDVAGR